MTVIFGSQFLDLIFLSILSFCCYLGWLLLFTIIPVYSVTLQIDTQNAFSDTILPKTLCEF